MQFDTPLIAATLVRRYKRFLADVTLTDGSAATAHVANSGSMLGLQAPGSRVWLSAAANPARKLPFSLEMVEADGGLVGVNTARPNALVAEAVTAGAVPELAGYGSLRREVKYGRNSRIDLLLEGAGRPACYVEVKNVTLCRDDAAYGRRLAEFPDAVTARGAKHLGELGDMVEAGHRAVMLYLVQRGDCDRFGLAADLDPAYAEAFAAARSRGVEALCYACTLGADAIAVGRPLPVAP